MKLLLAPCMCQRWNPLACASFLFFLFEIPLYFYKILGYKDRTKATKTEHLYSNHNFNELSRRQNWKIPHVRERRDNRPQLPGAYPARSSVLRPQHLITAEALMTEKGSRLWRWPAVTYFSPHPHMKLRPTDVPDGRGRKSRRIISSDRVTVLD